MTEVSVVIPTYNRIDLLKRTLKSLERQTVEKDRYEVVVVDDCSNDGTADFLRKLNFKGNLKFIIHKDSKKRAAARNSGIRLSKGDVVIFLDDDMGVKEDFIEQYLNSYKNRDCAGIKGGVKTVWVKNDIFLQYLNRKNRGAKRHKKFDRISFKYFLFSNASVRRELLFKAGFFDEKIKEYGGEDMEFAYRIESLKEGNFYYNPDAVSYHNHTRTFIDTCHILEKYGSSNLRYIVHKHPELAKVMFLNDRLFSGWFKKIFLKEGIYRLCMAFYDKLPPPIAFKLIKFCMGYALIKGYHENTYR